MAMGVLRHHATRVFHRLCLASLLIVTLPAWFRQIEPSVESFDQLPYESPAGVQWPERSVVLRELSTAMELSEPLRLHYVELNPSGSQVLVFLHGLGSYLKFWRYQLDRFANLGFRVIALDLPGFGKSSKPRAFGYSMQDQARVLNAFLSSIDAPKPVLVGHSMGGHISLNYAINYPESVRAIGLASPAGFERFSRTDKTWLKSVFTTSLLLSGTAESVYTNLVNNNFAQWRKDYEWLIAERLGLRRDPAFKDYAHANVKAVHGLLETEFTRAKINQISVPVMIVYGTRDRLIPNRFMHPGPTAEVMDYGHVKIKDSVLHALDGYGHTLQIDGSERFNAHLTEFLGGLA
ncbi:MAG: alpha/beta hydrolase [Myxococcota bacterium]